MECTSGINGFVVNIHQGYVTPESQMDLSHFFSFVCKISSLHTFHPFQAAVSVCGELFQASQVPLAKAQQAVQ